MILRPYQQQAVEAVYRHLRTREDNPVVVLPTGSGKSPIMATLCADAVNLWNGRVLILAHVKELLEQMYHTLHTIDPDLDVGLYSAGLKRRDTEHPVIIAGIQSIYKKACQIDPFDMVIVDEAHCIPPEGDGAYQRFLSESKVVNPHLRVVGLTATPYRMTTGMICRPDHFLNHICFEVGVRELIRDGYLCPLRTKASKERINTDSLHIRAGEFITSEVEELMDTEDRVRAACREILDYTRDRHSVLIFASGVAHGKHIRGVMEELSHTECGFVSGDSPPGWRKKMLDDFKSGTLKYLCNVNVLTTGFDAPNIDCIALLRPTMSPGLYSQMVGRGFRLHPSKQDCLVLDFGGNVLRHGPVDAIRVREPSRNKGEPPAKECPECNELIHAAYMLCPGCGYMFPEPNRGQHDHTASQEDVLSEIEVQEFMVQEVLYSVHTKKGAGPDDPKTMRVQYKVGFGHYISEWVCFEHSGFAHHKAVQWWSRRCGEPVPSSSGQAVDIALMGFLEEPEKIITQRLPGEKFERIVHYEFPQRDWQDQENLSYQPADDEIPF